jgi:putative transposase
VNHKLRLHRLERLYVEHPLYFITMCVEQRRPALNNEAVHRTVVAFGEQGVARGCYLGRYVLMPDHIHAFVAFGLAEMSSKVALSAWIKAFKGCVSKAWREEGPGEARWQKGCFDHVLRTAESCAEKWQYVVQNPVRAGLVGRWEDWPYQGKICRLKGAWT